MTEYEIVTVFLTRYTNEGIYMIWLDHFIKYNNCGLDKLCHILLIDGATCYEAPDFILKAKIYHI